jgi:hypothetical protein
MTRQLISTDKQLLLRSSHAKRPPQSGFVQVGLPDKFLLVRAAYRCVFEHNEIQLEKAQHPRGDSSRRRLMTTTLLLHLDSFARWEGLETGPLTLGYRIDFKGTGGEGGIPFHGHSDSRRFADVCSVTYFQTAEMI